MQTIVDQEGIGQISTADTLKILGLGDKSQKTLRKYAKAVGVPTHRGFYYTNEISLIREAMEGTDEMGSLDAWLKSRGENQVKEKAETVTREAKNERREQIAEEHEEAYESGATGIMSVNQAYAQEAQKLGRMMAENFLVQVESSFFASLGELASKRGSAIEKNFANLIEGVQSTGLLLESADEE